MRRFLTCTALALLMCGVQSCIWEDREQCPSFLSLDFSGTPEEVERIYLVLTHQDGWTCRDTLLREDFGNSMLTGVRAGVPLVRPRAGIKNAAAKDGDAGT